MKLSTELLEELLEVQRTLKQREQQLAHAQQEVLRAQGAQDYVVQRIARLHKIEGEFEVLADGELKLPVATAECPTLS